MIKVLPTKNHRHGWFILVSVLILQGCFKLHVSPERSASELVGASIDTVIESTEVINGHRENYRNRKISSGSMRIKKWIRNRKQNMTYEVQKLSDGSFVFDRTNGIRTGCVTRYYADKNRIITSYEFLNPDQCYWD